MWSGIELDLDLREVQKKKRDSAFHYLGWQFSLLINISSVRSIFNTQRRHLPLPTPSFVSASSTPNDQSRPQLSIQLQCSSPHFTGHAVLWKGNLPRWEFSQIVLSEIINFDTAPISLLRPNYLVAHRPVFGSWPHMNVSLSRRFNWKLALILCTIHSWK